MPRGSGKNIGRTNILTGQPVSEDASGNIRLADASHVAFAVAATGTPPGGVVTWQTDGIITRTDWTNITGSKELIPGQRYYVSGTGLLSTSGSQQVGVARSSQDLRVEVQALSSSVVASGSTSTIVSPSGFQIIAGTSNANSLVSFFNSNGVSFGLSANTLTASHNGLTVQSNQSLGLFAVSNTTQGTSGTQDARSLSFAGLGVASVGVTNGSVVISVPAGGAAVGDIDGGLPDSIYGGTTPVDGGSP